MDNPRETSVKPHDSAEGCNENVTAPVAIGAETCDNGSVNKNGSGSATNTVNPEPDHCKGVADLIVPKLPTWVTDETTAIHYLEFAHHGYQTARETRTHAAITARHHGIPNRVIGEIYGIAESTVRLMLKRAGER